MFDLIFSPIPPYCPQPPCNVKIYPNDHNQNDFNNANSVLIFYTSQLLSTLCFVGNLNRFPFNNFQNRSLPDFHLLRKRHELTPRLIFLVFDFPLHFSPSFN